MSRFSTELRIARRDWTRKMDRDATQDRKPRFSIKWLLIAVGICAIAFALMRFGQRLFEPPNDAYAMWAAGDVLLGYMNDNQGNWPGSWDELADHHTKSGGGSTIIGAFSEMQSRIAIDFSFDPNAVIDSLEATDVAPDFRVVSLKDGGNAHWAGWNQINGSLISSNLRSSTQPPRIETSDRYPMPGGGGAATARASPQWDDRGMPFDL